jgi:hypothetical protein
VVAQVRPASAVLLASADAAADVLALATTTGCVRGELLGRYGELLERPCGHCSSD